MAYSMEEGKKLVVEAGLKLVRSGLIARTWGNVSARVSDNEFVITPSGIPYEKLTPDDIVPVKIDNCSYDKEGLKPSSEKGVHPSGAALIAEGIAPRDSLHQNGTASCRAVQKLIMPAMARI